MNNLIDNLVYGTDKDTVSVIVVPVWLNSVVIAFLAIMTILMGICVYVACINFNIYGIVIYGVIEYSFLSILFHWHKIAYMEMPKKHKPNIIHPSDEAMSVHKISEPAVYLLQDVDVTGYVKIGRSKTPTKRLLFFGVKLPFETRLIHVIKHKDDKMVESFLHDFFRSRRVRGEWFALTEMDIEIIKRFNPNVTE